MLFALFVPLLLGYMVFPMSAIVIDSQLADIADEHELRMVNALRVSFFRFAALALKRLRVSADSWLALVWNSLAFQKVLKSAILRVRRLLGCCF